MKTTEEKKLLLINSIVNTYAEQVYQRHYFGLANVQYVEIIEYIKATVKKEHEEPLNKLVEIMIETENSLYLDVTMDLVKLSTKNILAKVETILEAR